MRHTKHDSLSGRKAVRPCELDLPSKAEMRKVDRWLSGRPSRTELPKQNNIEERKRRNRARAKAVERSIRWQQENREAYNARRRAWRRRRKLAKGEEAKQAEQGGVAAGEGMSVAAVCDRRGGRVSGIDGHRPPLQ